MKNFLDRKLVVAGLGSLIIGAVGAAGVFAAIPDSNTKVITACRNNVTGSLKAIDAQNGATCNGFETKLAWSGDLTPQSSGGGAKTAIFHATPDSSDPDFTYVYNPAFSRGILEAKKLVANDPANNPGDYRGYCLELGFTVLHSSSNEHAQAILYPAALEGTGLDIADACGPGFDVFLNSDLTASIRSTTREVFFSE